MADRPPPGLSSDQKSALLSKLRKKQSEEPARTISRGRQALDPGLADFSALPQFREMQHHRAAGELAGIPNYYFLPHDGAAGAVTRMNGRELINFSSYDYLGLNTHSDVLSTAKAAMDRYGVSASASRLVAGERPIHQALEQALCSFHGRESALAFVSGYGTNATTIGTLMGAEDVIFHDAFSHRSLVTGAQLSGAARIPFPHNDLTTLESVLRRQRAQHRHALIVVEGLYSMDGDFPDLPKLIALKKQYGAWLMVDEAHSVGTLGATGRGLCEHWDVDPGEVDITMGTLSKTLSGCGGYIVGSRNLIDILRHFASGFVYSVGMPPAIAAASLEALTILTKEPERVARLQELGRYFVSRAGEAGLDTGLSAGYAVTPLIVGDSLRAAKLSDLLLKRGVCAMPIIHPAVPENAARLRFFLSSAHTREQLDRAIEIFAEELAGLLAQNFGVSTIADRLLPR